MTVLFNNVHYSNNIKTNMGVYKITNKLDGKFYIGSTCTSFIKRWNEHKHDSIKRQNQCPYLYRAMNKYGFENFEFEVLVVCHTKQECKDIEQKHLDVLDWENAYNVCLSSYAPMLGRTGDKCPNFGREWTEEQKQTMSDRVMGEGNPFFGKKHSEETKTKISKKNHVSLKNSWDNDPERHASITGENNVAKRPEVKLKQSEFSKNRWTNPEYREKTIQAMSEAKKKWWQERKRQLLEE